MKKIISILMCLCVVFSMFIATNVLALTSGDWEYVKLSQSTVEITSYNGTAIDLTIPSYIGGLKVVSIGYQCFGNDFFGGNEYLSTVTIPDTVTEIKEEAFCRCDNLTYVKLSKNLKTIGADAFSHTGLRSITIPKSCTKLGDYAFYVSDLTKAVIPPSVTSIGTECFNSCLGLSEIYDVVFYGKSGSYAYKYAKLKGIKFKNIYKPSKPSTTSISSIKSSKKKTITLKWKKVSGAKYVIAYSTSKSKLNKLKNGKVKVSGVKTLKTSSLSKTIKSLKSKKKYYVKVCAYKTYYNTSDKTLYVYGNWSKVKSVKTK